MYRDHGRKTKFEYDKKLLEMKGTAPSLDVKEVTAQSGTLRDEIDAFNSAERARGLVEASIMILKDARDSFFEENPPVAIVVIECSRASKRFIPKIQYETKQSKVKIR